MPLSPQARDLTIRVILAEARGEGPEGQRAVANVILNRLNSGAWGAPEQGALAHLLTAKGQFAAPHTAGPDDPMYQRVGAIVDDMASQPTEDNTGGATHFYSPANMPGGVEPSWATGQQGRRIGGHVFYTLPFTASNTAGTVDLHAPPPTVQTSPPLDASRRRQAGRAAGSRQRSRLRQDDAGQE